MDADQELSTLDDLANALDLAASADEVMVLAERWRWFHPHDRFADGLIYDAWRAFTRS